MDKFLKTGALHTLSNRLRNSYELIDNTITGKIKLRDYQEDAIEAVKKAINRGVRRPAVVLATGGGKTVVFSHLLNHLQPNSPYRGNKTLILAHKEELIKQATDTVRLVNPNLKVDIDMRKLKPSADADVVVASVPTLVRLSRLQQYNPKEFKTIILDECHHATANSWIKILKYFEADTKKSDIHVIGFTATMERSDGQELGKMFDEIVFQRGLLEMIKNKELADIRFSAVEADIDFASVTTRDNDYVVSSLSKIMSTIETNLILGLAYIQLKKKYNFKSTLIFCVDVSHCQTLCGVLQKEGINAQYVTGATAKHERVKIIEDFKEGVIEVLCNVLVFTEGTDIPNIDSLFLARPTKSRPLLVQMLGRGLRLHKSKSHCHVIDIAGSTHVGIQSVPTLFSLPQDYKIDGKSCMELIEEKREIEKRDDIKDLLREERERRRQEQIISDKLRELQLSDDFMLSFDTFMGYVELENMYNKKVKSMVEINEVINNSTLSWIRTDYGAWAHQIDDIDFYYIQLQNRGKKLPFKLTINRFTTREQKFGSKYKCGNHRIVSKLNCTPNIKEIIAQAEELKSTTKYNSIDYFHGDSPLSDNQFKYITEKLRKKVSSTHSDKQKALDNFQKGLKLFNKTRANDLIFALNISVNSLWVKWELNNILGVDSKTKSELKKIKNRTEKNLHSLPSSV